MLGKRQKTYRSLKDSLVWQVPVFRYCKKSDPDDTKLKEGGSTATNELQLGPPS
jgi:hypothetical protein